MEPVQAEPKPEPTPEPSQGGPHGGGFHRSSVIRVGLLLVAVIGIAAAGIVIGKALEPSSSSSVSTSTTVAVTPVTTPTTTTTQHAAGSRGWGPLAVKVEGSFPAGGDRAGAALAAKTLVVAGGTGSSRVLAGPASGTLVRVAALPGPRTAPIVFALGNTVYVIGGEAATTPTDAIFQLDTKTNKLVPGGTFEEPIAEAGVAARGGSAYLVGGWTGTQYATAVLKFTPPSTVDLVGRLPVGVRSAAVVLLRNTLYVAGGRTAAGLSRRVFAVDIGSGSGDLARPVAGGGLSGSPDRARHEAVPPRRRGRRRRSGAQGDQHRPRDRPAGGRGQDGSRPARCSRAADGDRCARR